MQLPQTSAANLFRFSADAKYVLTDASNNCSSVINLATQLPVLQGTLANQPLWSRRGLGGTYFFTNFPGKDAPGSVGQDALSFTAASSQFMTYNALSASAAGAEVPLTVCCAVSCATPTSATARTVWSFGAAGANPLLTLKYVSSTLVLTQISDGATHTTTATDTPFTDTGVHVVSAVKTGTALNLRVDGVQVATAAITAGTETFTTFTVGALGISGTTSLYFDGLIGTMVAYAGVADIQDVETYLMAEYGISRQDD